MASQLRQAFCQIACDATTARPIYNMYFNKFYCTHFWATLIPGFLIALNLAPVARYNTIQTHFYMLLEVYCLIVLDVQTPAKCRCRHSLSRACTRGRREQQDQWAPAGQRAVGLHPCEASPPPSDALQKCAPIFQRDFVVYIPSQFTLAYGRMGASVQQRAAAVAPVWTGPR